MTTTNSDRTERGIESPHDCQTSAGCSAVNHDYTEADLRPRRPDRFRHRGESMSEAPSRTYGNDPIAGVCPSCRTGPLFLTSNNHVVCTRITCENPLAVDTLLHDRIAMNLALSAISEADKRKEATP